MKLFMGTKLIQAEPMSRASYNNYRGWVLPADEDGTDAGFLVEYMDGGKTNHPLHRGYISWSPADVFMVNYQHTDALSFGHAVEMLKLGHKVARKGWNSKGMFLFLVPGGTINVTADRPLGMAAPDLVGTTLNYLPHVDMKTAQGDVVPWLASQSDILADDWTLIFGEGE